MPHQCTNCGRTFADGSKEMLSGCPDCGGNKFQFQPKGAAQRDAEATTASADSTASGTTSDDARAADGTRSESSTSPQPNGTSASASTTAETTSPETTSESSSPDPDATQTADATADPDRAEASTVGSPDGDQPAERQPGTGEDTAQASARSDVVTKEELEASASKPPQRERDEQPPTTGDAPEPPDASGEVVEAPEQTSAGLEQLREELNEQFESIKIVEPGQYELNLMGLYDREEYIVSLQEDGRYVIEVPETWRRGPEDE
jgi:hypothetical protein